MEKTCLKCDTQKKKTMFYIGVKGRKDICMLCENKEKKKKARNKKRKNIANERRCQSGEGISTVVYRKHENRTSVARRVYIAESEHLFMQFNAIIYRHVKEIYGLSKNELDLLLLVYPLKPFWREDMKVCREIMEFKQLGLLAKFLKEDYIYVWRNALTPDNSKKLYDFTTKGRKLMKDIHEWGLGKKKVPEVAGKNIMDIMAKLYKN